MFGDNTDQDQNTVAPAADGTVNPSAPVADTAATTDSAAPSAPDMTFPSVPVVGTDPVGAPAATDALTTDSVTDQSVAPSPMDDTSLADDTTSVTPEASPAPEAAAPAELLSSDEMAADDTPVEAPSLTSSEDTPAVDDTSSSTDDSATLEPGSEELIDIKQQALEDLGPLVDKLDQTPEERFRTTMMLIQASDNQTLVKQAFDAAQKIEDDKERAQALLDVINEINYFTTQKKD